MLEHVCDTYMYLAVVRWGKVDSRECWIPMKTYIFATLDERNDDNPYSTKIAEVSTTHLSLEKVINRRLESI